MNKVSVYIIAYNEADKIRDAINSVLWADEIVVADSNSQDNTAALAEEMGARVVQIPFRGFGDLRNRAMAGCTYDWIFGSSSFGVDLIYRGIKSTPNDEEPALYDSEPL